MKTNSDAARIITSPIATPSGKSSEKSETREERLTTSVEITRVRTYSYGKDPDTWYNLVGPYGDEINDLKKEDLLLFFDLLKSILIDGRSIEEQRKQLLGQDN